MTASDYIAVISGDDFFLPQRFATRLSAMRANCSLAFCYSNGLVCNEKGHLTKISVHNRSALSLLRARREEVEPRLFCPVPALFTQCALFRRDALIKIGGWDEELIIDDWPLNIRLFRSFPDNHAYTGDFVCAYRRHGSNASKRRFRQYLGKKRVLEKYASCREYRQGMFELYAEQSMASIKRRQWNRARVFLRAATRHRPALPLALLWMFHEAYRRSLHAIR